MCGICGVFRFGDDEPISRRELGLMTRMLAHRGPDDEATHIEPGLGLGHRRLSIIAVADGRQPLANECGRIWTTFNGEIYNHRTLRDHLIGKGHRFRTAADTEVLVHLYEEHGVDFPSFLDGMFAVAIWDRDRRRIVLARDRLGQKPLYYKLDDRQLLFASELKAILAYPGVERIVNREAVHHFLSLGSIPTPLTAFEGINKLAAGTTLTVEPGRSTERRYWSLSFRSRANGGVPPADQLDEALQRAVESHLESEVPMGVFLSGGVDSSTIAHRLVSAAPENTISTTIRIGDPRYDESPHAQRVADFLGSDHRVYDVGPGAVDVIERILWHFDEPFGDSSAVPLFHLCALSRESITVALSGDGGDEMFAGYDWHSQFVREQRLREALPRWARAAVGRLGAVYPRFVRGRALLENLAMSSEQAAANPVFLFAHRDKRSLYSGEFLEDLDSHPRTEQRLADVLTGFDSGEPLTRVLLRDYTSYLSDDILTKVDRMSMAHSLEVRPPLLDHHLVELAASLPIDVKLHNGQTKWIFKEVLSRYVPSELFLRPKQGFSIPLGSWFRGELKEFLYGTLFDGRLERRGYFDPRYLADLWRMHQRRSRAIVDLTHHLWSLAMLELWHRLYIDSDDFLTRPYSLANDVYMSDALASAPSPAP